MLKSVYTREAFVAKKPGSAGSSASTFLAQCHAAYLRGHSIPASSQRKQRMWCPTFAAATLSHARKAVVTRSFKNVPGMRHRLLQKAEHVDMGNKCVQYRNPPLGSHSSGLPPVRTSACRAGDVLRGCFHPHWQCELGTVECGDEVCCALSSRLFNTPAPGCM